MATGKVKWFDTKKGFGFINPDAGGRELFVHHTAIVGTGYKSLTEGQRVRFNTADSDKGPKAVDVVAE